MSKRVKKVYTVQDARNAKKRFTVALCIVLALVIVTGTVLGFVNRPGLDFLADYRVVRIESSSASATILRTTDENEVDQYKVNQIFNNGLKKTRYSVLRMLLETNYKPHLAFETEEETYINDKDKEKTRQVRVELKGSQITNASRSQDTEYTLRFTFDRNSDGSLKKYIKVGGEAVYFDTAIINVSTDGNNTIESFTLRVYDSHLLQDDTAESFNYVVNPIIVKAKTNAFVNSLQDILDYFKQI